MNFHLPLNFFPHRALQVLAGRIATLFLIGGVLFPLRAQSAVAQTSQMPSRVGLMDTIDIADLNSEKAHSFRSSGEVSREIVGEMVGDHDTRRLSRTVRGAGSWLSFQMRVDPLANTTLEIEERDGRGRDARGYTVFIDNRRTYFRTWQSNGAGPLHFFVQFPPTGQKQVTVKLVNASATAFSISRLWSFAAFDRYFRAAQMAVPYYVSPMLRLNPDNVEGDLARLETIKTSLGQTERARAAWGTWIPYVSMGAHETERLIDHALLLAQKSRMPVQLALDTWWASTPGGLDGQGGFWSDLAYQQVVYNATQKRYQLSIPNRWSSVPWLSLNNDALNAFKARRLRETVQYLARRLTALRAQNTENSHPLLLAISLDNEPVYWASGAAGLGPDLLWADFSAQTVAAAQRDGVLLDPTDGLSLAERHWLQANLLRYHRLIAQTVSEALGNDATIIAPDGVRIPQDLVRHNVYTQAWIANGDNQYPMQNSAFPFWESAAPKGARIGGEWNGDSLRENGILQHMIALGRNAAINAEAGNKAAENEGVLPGYALGQRFYTPYNYPLDKMDVLTEKLRPAQSFATHLYLPTLRENDFRGDGWKQQVVAWEGLEAGLINGVQVVNPASTQQAGFLLYKIDAPAASSIQNTTQNTKSSFDALFLEFAGRAFVSQKQDEAVQIRVLAGTAPETTAMREVGRVFNFGDMNAVQRMDLSALARGQRTLWVRLELHAPGIPETVRSWSSLYYVRFSTGWPAALTSDLPAQDESLERVRAQNLLVSWRSDAEDALAQLTAALAANSNAASAARLQQARAQFARGEYAMAYHVANQGLSLNLPAAFWIADKGQLGSYPLQIELTPAQNTSANEGVWCRLLQATPQVLQLQLPDASGRTLQVLASGLRPNSAYRATQSASDEWKLERVDSRAQNAELAPLRSDERGQLRWKIVVPTVAAPLQEMLTGVFRSVLGEQNPSLLLFPGDGSNRRALPLKPDTILLRGRSGEAAKPASKDDFRFGDQLEISGGVGATPLRISAQYDEIEGKVAAFGTLTPFAMPFIELQGHPQRYRIDLLAPLHLPTGDTLFRTAGPDKVVIAPGTQVRLRVNPVLQRAFELWVVPPP